LADELNIPNIINFPGPLGMLKYVSVNFPQSENQSLFFGSIIQTLSFETLFKNFILKMAWNSSVRIRSYQKFMDRVVLVNSFWGLDQPY
jgi:hypothetical protein